MNAIPTASGWYYARGDSSNPQPSGPVSWEELWGLAQAGTLARADVVWHPSLPEWVPADRIAGLFPEPAPLSADSGVVPSGTQAGYGVPQAGYGSSSGQGAEALRHSRRSWLYWAVPLAVVVVAAAVLGSYFGLIRDRDGGTAAGLGKTTTTARAPATTSTAPATTTTTEPPWTWTMTGPAGGAPPPRSGQSVVYDSSNGTMILFGGTDGAVSRFDDTWAYDAAANTWSDLDPPGELPYRRSGQAMVYDSTRDKVLMFGGTDSDGSVLDETWEYDPKVNTWTYVEAAGKPPARTGHSMVYDPVSGAVILFGGMDSESFCLNDTWAYDAAAKSWTELTTNGSPPSGRYGQAMVYDPTDRKIVLFGGRASASVSAWDDTYTYDPSSTTWARVEPTGTLPPARYGHSLVWDATRGTVVMFGGSPGDTPEVSLNDTWEYAPTAGAWTELDPEGDLPATRTHQSMAYDPKTESVLLFGGQDMATSNCYDDVWAYGLHPAGATTTSTAWEAASTSTTVVATHQWGNTIDLHGVKITVAEPYTDWDLYWGSRGVKDETVKVILVKVTIENTGKHNTFSVGYGGCYFDLIDSFGASCSSQAFDPGAISRTALPEEAPPGKKVSGYLAYVVSNDTSAHDIELHDGATLQLITTWGY